MGWENLQAEVEEELAGLSTRTAEVTDQLIKTTSQGKAVVALPAHQDVAGYAALFDTSKTAHQLAAELGISPSCVQSRRRILGIVMPRGRPSGAPDKLPRSSVDRATLDSPEKLAVLLDTSFTNEQAAHMLGVSRFAVRGRRQLLGVRLKRGRPFTKLEHPAIDDLSLSSSAAAAIIGVDKKLVLRLRAEKGLEHKQAHPAARDPLLVKEMVDLSRPAREAAALLGVSLSTVYKYRTLARAQRRAELRAAHEARVARAAAIRG